MSNSQFSMKDLTIASGPGLSISLNNVPEIDSKFKYGVNDDVGTSFETIWEGGGLYQHPATAGIATVKSTSLLDTLLGTGARQIVIEGLDQNFLFQEEVIDLNGQTSVNSLNTYIRLNRAYVLTAGTDTGAIGVISIDVDGIVALAQISPEKNQTQICHYTIPADKNGYLNSVFISCGQGKEIEAGIWFKTEGGVYRNLATIVLFENYIDADFSVPGWLPPKSDIEVRAKAIAGSVNVTASLTIIEKDI